MLPTCLLPLAALLVAPPAPPAVTAAHAIAGAVVFDLDRGEQWTVAIDDDGVVTAMVIDRAPRAAARPGGGGAPVLPTHLERIDLTADGASVIVRGDGRAIAVRLAAE